MVTGEKNGTSRFLRSASSPCEEGAWCWQSCGHPSARKSRRIQMAMIRVPNPNPEDWSVGCSSQPEQKLLPGAAPVGAWRSAAWRSTATGACVPICTSIVSPISTNPYGRSSDSQVLVEAAAMLIRLAAMVTLQLASRSLLLLSQSSAIAGPPFCF